MTYTLPQTFSFSLMDELFFHLDQPVSPFSLQMEVRVDERLDAERLEAAIQRAAENHPMMRVSMAPYQPSDKTYCWNLHQRLDQVPLKVVQCDDEEALDNVRTELHTLSVPLAEAPPFRCVLAHCEGGDLLLINLSHSVSDGVGLYRFMASILRAYANVSDPVPELDFLTARDLRHEIRSKNLAERLGRIRKLLGVLGSAILPPTRIASEDLDEQPGLGFVPLRFSASQTSRLEHLRKDGSTINDVLLAGLHMAIERWNQQHEKNSGRTSIMLPINARAQTHAQELAANLSLWVNVVSQADERADFQTLLKAITRQTSHFKEKGNAGLLIELLYEIRSLPLWAKKALPGLLPLTGNRIVDTTVFNNLGRVPNPLPEDAELKMTEVWFSSPCRAPMGLSLGAATLYDRLYLSFRYQRQHMSREGAWAFAETFLDILEQAHTR